MEQRDYDELQRNLAAYPTILPESTLQEMERQYHLACTVGCSISEFQEFDENTPYFFGLLLREVKRLRAKEQEERPASDDYASILHYNERVNDCTCWAYDALTCMAIGEGLDRDIADARYGPCDCTCHEQYKEQGSE